jgi:hypothetical protein
VRIENYFAPKIKKPPKPQFQRLYKIYLSKWLEVTGQKMTSLQSAPFGHSGTLPYARNRIKPAFLIFKNSLKCIKNHIIGGMNGGIETKMCCKYFSALKEPLDYYIIAVYDCQHFFMQNRSNTMKNTKNKSRFALRAFLILAIIV